jgi:Lipoxygenase
MTNAETEAANPVVPIPPPSTDHVAQLPVQEWGFVNCPAIPYWADEVGDPDFEQIGNTIDLLKQRAAQGASAYAGLDTDYTIGGQTLPASAFLYGPPPAATKLQLDDPSQFTLAWTTYQDVYEDSQDLVGPFSDTLQETKKKDANDTLWPAIAQFGLPLNLLVLEKVDSDRFSQLTKEFGDAWADEEVRDLLAADGLYAIDMSILESVGSSPAPDGSVRFAPATITYLKQDPTSKALTPVSIQVWTKGVSPQNYVRSDKAWLWALQAAKTSITVWGIWLGHVYHWHTVTAAMQMTMYNTLPADHRLSPLLRRQSQSVINFNYVLLTLLWGKITPPTPVGGYMSLLKLLDTFAETGPKGKRGFFDDDPANELKARRLDAKDFKAKVNGKEKDWAAYPLVGYLLEIWGATNEFVKAVVDDIYKTDDQVANDGDLQKWIAASGDPSQGNIRGLPDVKRRAKLVEVLTSLLYRVNVHGAASLNPSVNPALAFVANFPPCLQSTDIPKRSDQPDLLKVLPHTGTIGQMTTFVFTFAYSPPYASLIPGGGIDLDPWFPPSQQQCNGYLVTFRERIRDFVDQYVDDWNAELGRLAKRPPGSLPPAYAENQYQQWPSSIEI